ncbi:hypothetical protein [Gephyromycinifex aptenodytis]|uniref:hypothetical protein n=1 Tax=Gephyromycinifex aptenodytis TaxID=2716227 RepID=UPI00144633B4|nr:hypothetical protein [Gephyromycinifex aptenodytis]
MSASESLQLADQTAQGLKAGTWESVEALAVLAMAHGTGPAAQALVAQARAAADSCKAGTWPAVRALAWLAQAEDALAG